MTHLPDDLRRQHTAMSLSESDVAADPLRQFDAWFEAATRTNLAEPNAMALATADPRGRPSVRFVLLKSYGPRGFVFHTSYDSPKARDLAANPRAAACFWWEPLERQVRIEGRVELLPPAESDAYFATRPRESQLAAHASQQSSVVANRDELERRLAEAEDEYRGKQVPRPPRWGGFLIVPDLIEFWQGRPHRLHDRLRYRRDATGRWTIERLSP